MIVEIERVVFSFNVLKNTQSFRFQKETPEIPVGFVVGQKIRNADQSEIFSVVGRLKKNRAGLVQRNGRAFSIFEGPVDDMFQGLFQGLALRRGTERSSVCDACEPGGGSQKKRNFQYRSYTP